jgi:hypothetical protein
VEVLHLLIIDEGTNEGTFEKESGRTYVSVRLLGKSLPRYARSQRSEIICLYEYKETSYMKIIIYSWYAWACKKHWYWVSRRKLRGESAQAARVKTKTKERQRKIVKSHKDYPPLQSLFIFSTLKGDKSVLQWRRFRLFSMRRST